MVITISVFYYLYLLVVMFFILYGLFNIYHLLIFGFFSFANILVIVLYVAVAMIILNFSFTQLALIDWQQPLFSAESNNLF
ncbi:MAG: hypothetical protein WC610_01645 [Patescibacteria group bacterium]